MVRPERDTSPELQVSSNPAICLRSPYGIPGTDQVYGAISLRAPYAMSGTDTAYGAIQLAGNFYERGEKLV
eukprot:826931-Rhodomonas_salina.1